VSTSSQSIAERVLRLVGHPEVIDRPWFATGRGRAEHTDELDEMVGGWIAKRSAAEVTAAFEEAQAAIAPIYDVRDVFADPQYAALGTIASVEDDELGAIKMQNQLFRMSGTPGRIRWSGRTQGHDTAEVLAELGVDAAALEDLRSRGVA
jgi:crotonobetainyl-CoA:carnitine CoA-transferase CaiB-like acyl-CoA transferase